MDKQGKESKDRSSWKRVHRNKDMWKQVVGTGHNSLKADKTSHII